MSDAWERPVSGWPVGAWAMAGMLPIVGGIGISAEVLSPGLALDLISLWPGLMPAVAALGFVAVKKAWRRRMGALPPLLIITWIALAVSAHIAALEPLPSSSADLIGPTEFPDHVTLAAHSPGVLEVRVHDRGAIYRVGFVRLGGEIGIARAEEVSTAFGLTVSIGDAGPTEWFRYAGWTLDLAPGTRWNLSLGGELEGDLTGLDLGSVSLDGNGALTFGITDHPVPVAVRGDFDLRIPADVAARVVGSADVPSGWVTTGDGFRSPIEGEGWVISAAAGSSVVINGG
ncbi:MAG TPA: hypothetical protein VJQ79_03490 [Acidimicrobiia bacterium]|nr:hypothetical protein [Acidimicrobiia bacterium]